MHGSVSILVLHVDVGVLCHQQLHQLGVPLRHRQLQRRLVAVVPDVDVAASLRVFGCFTELMELNLLVENDSTLFRPSAHLFDEDLSHIPMVVESSQV